MPRRLLRTRSFDPGSHSAAERRPCSDSSMPPQDLTHPLGDGCQEALVGVGGVRVVEDAGGFRTLGPGGALGGPSGRRPCCGSLLVWVFDGCSQPGSGCWCAAPVPWPRKGQHPAHHSSWSRKQRMGPSGPVQLPPRSTPRPTPLRNSTREITGAVVCHFDPGQAPPLIHLHHVRQELLAL